MSGAERTLGWLVEERLREAEEEGLSAAYRRSIRQYLRAFAAGRESTPVSAIDRQMVVDWFRARSESPSTRASNLGRLASLFGLGVRLGLLSSNPVALIKPPRLHRPPPRILSPGEARDILGRCRRDCPDILAWIVLGLFAGLRPTEALALPWFAVDLEAGRIRVERTKTGRRRVVILEPAAVEWLRICPRAGERCCPSWSTVRRRRRALAHDWPQDVLRHTAASYLLELHQDVGKVALWLGNSPRILREHYHELVTPEECAKFWAIRPS